MKKKTIVVTSEDIAEGERHAYCECPIARAVRRSFRAPSHRKIVVRLQGIFVGDLEDDRMWVATLSPVALRFMVRFDKGLSVKPAAFELTFR